MTMTSVSGLGVLASQTGGVISRASGWTPSHNLSVSLPGNGSTMPTAYGAVGDLAIFGLIIFNGSTKIATLVSNNIGGAGWERICYIGDTTSGFGIDVWAGRVTATGIDTFTSITYSGTTAGVGCDIYPDSITYSIPPPVWLINGFGNLVYLTGSTEATYNGGTPPLGVFNSGTPSAVTYPTLTAFNGGEPKFLWGLANSQNGVTATPPNNWNSFISSDLNQVIWKFNPTSNALQNPVAPQSAGFFQAVLFQAEAGVSGTPLAFANPGTISGTDEIAFSLGLAHYVSGGTGPYTYSATGLPGTLALNTLTGVISGTPTAVANYSIDATVTPFSGSPISQTFSIDIAAAVSNPSGVAPPVLGATDPVTGFPWQLVDDFTGTQLNQNWWQGFYDGTNSNGGSPFAGNNGAVGSNPSTNASVPSCVVLVAGPNAPGGDGGTGFNTQNFGYFTEGHFTVRAKCSLGQGYVMCLGMIGQGISPWPPEVDFYEDENGTYQNSDTQRNSTVATVHTDPGNTQNFAQEQGLNATAWHTWELIYNGNSEGVVIQFLCDSVQWGSLQGGSITYGTGANALGLPMVMFMQLEDGDGTSKTGNISLVTMEIDWVAIACPSGAITPGSG